MKIAKSKLLGLEYINNNPKIGYSDFAEIVGCKKDRRHVHERLMYWCDKMYIKRVKHGHYELTPYGKSILSTYLIK